MLDTETKRRIDTARDILVGKVPDPKSQVEQITIALIYKFMDDMDAEAEELGGKRSFFAGEFEKYGWSKLMAPGMGGHEVLNMYAEAITRMNENAGIPPLFRDIFKNAYLPYRDPETLKMILKTIAEFEYDHSERLGDAFEYLLSVLGSQGDAGQFRTPRHIIDFMVEVIDPKKDETILDPACGTAGFLISSYKHILKSNTKDGRKGAGLTPDDRARLARNIKGYDISPDMVRLSLVNLYLHGFTDPHIDEYDTLTSEDKWNEYADVILANPPFMSPKGGIKPHKRFSVQSKRSEVLFVDYMAEHLTPNGRAAIIVPEGIIFQSQNAHKQLRKMLMEEYLFAVVSLPSGVFNPYAGVKTSILFLDKALAKKSDSILFVKIEHEGFDLGAQRRPNGKSDLPEAVCSIKNYVSGIINGETFDAENIANVLVVAKEKIGGNGDWNLSGERYRDNDKLRNSKYEMLELGEVCEINPKKSQISHLDKDLEVSFVAMANVNENKMYFDAKETRKIDSVFKGYTYFQNDDVLLAKVTPCFENGKASLAKQLANGIGFGSSEFYVLRAFEKIKPEWIFYNVTSNRFRNEGKLKMTGTGGLQRIPIDFVKHFKIPLPPLEIQKEIIVEIEGYQKIIDGARAVVENYRPHIHIDPEWEIVELGKICENLDGKRVPITKSDRKTGQYPYYGASGIVDYVDDYIFDDDLLLISEDGANLLARVTPIAFSVSGKIWVNNHAHVLKFDNRDTQLFVEMYVNSINIDNYVTGSAQPKLNQKYLNSINIPFPSLETQKHIIAQIGKEQVLVNANKELIAIFEQKIKDKIASVWGE